MILFLVCFDDDVLDSHSHPVGLLVPGPWPAGLFLAGECRTVVYLLVCTP
jgi:hypothetical protein